MKKHHMNEWGLLLGSLVFALTLSLAAAQEDPTVDVMALSLGSGTITDYLDEHANSVVSTPDVNCYDVEEADAAFNCLAQALAETGLSETLAGEGPFTLFAPTDAAFKDFAEGMDRGDWNALFTDPEALRPILSYHVLPEKMTLEALAHAADANTGDYLATTVAGSDLLLNFASKTTDEAGLMTVTLADTAYATSRTIQVGNGVIIPIDQVLSVPAD